MSLMMRAAVRAGLVPAVASVQAYRSFATVPATAKAGSDALDLPTNKPIEEWTKEELARMPVEMAESYALVRANQDPRALIDSGRHHGVAVMTLDMIMPATRHITQLPVIRVVDYDKYPPKYDFYGQGNVNIP